MSKTQQFTLSLHSSADDPLALALRRACDRCRKRKTRCDGRETCRTCSKAGVECSYLTVPKPLGRRPRHPRPTKDLKLPYSPKQSEHSPTTQPQESPSFPLVSPGIYTITDDTSESEPPHARPLASADAVGSTFILAGQDSSSFDPGQNGSSDWTLPTPNLFSPLMNGALPFDGTLDGIRTDAQPQPQAYLPADDFSGILTETYSVDDHVNQPPQTSSKLPTAAFLPYVKLYFDRLYPVFPVLDKETMPSEERLNDPFHTPWDQYGLLSALAAAATVQLNIVASSTSSSPRPYSNTWSDSTFPSVNEATEVYSAEFWASQALEARRNWDFMSDPTEATIVTSFFLYVYYGNRYQPKKAMYYLREAIGFAIAIGLDDPDTYDDLTARVAQRRCRLFWLLFVTERSDALQYKTSAMLRSSIELPRIFESDNPKLIYGFVSLVKLFKSVDDKFLSLWKRSSNPGNSHPSKQQQQQQWQQIFRAALADQNAASIAEIVEIQRLDIMVTQQWLHLLAWRLQSGKVLGGSESSSKCANKGSLTGVNSKFAFAISRDTLQTITKADRGALESHGIGVENKIFEIACCLSDVLRGSPRLTRETISIGHQYLHGFLTVLSFFRNQESSYLQPLLARATETLNAELSVPASLPYPEMVGGVGNTWPGAISESDGEEQQCELMVPNLLPS